MLLATGCFDRAAEGWARISEPVRACPGRRGCEKLRPKLTSDTMAPRRRGVRLITAALLLGCGVLAGGDPVVRNGDHARAEAVGYLRRALAYVSALGSSTGAAVDAVGSSIDQLQHEADAGAFERKVAQIHVDIQALASRSSPSRSTTSAEQSADESVGGEPPLLTSFVSWALDRPVPWERDCSCCYPFCPADRWCIKQGDKRFLACAGLSVRQHLRIAFADQCAHTAPCAVRRARAPSCRPHARDLPCPPCAAALASRWSSWASL